MLRAGEIGVMKVWALVSVPAVSLAVAWWLGCVCFPIVVGFLFWFEFCWLCLGFLLWLSPFHSLFLWCLLSGWGCFLLSVRPWFQCRVHFPVFILAVLPTRYLTASAGMLVNDLVNVWIVVVGLLSDCLGDGFLWGFSSVYFSMFFWGGGCRGDGVGWGCHGMVVRGSLLMLLAMIFPTWGVI